MKIKIENHADGTTRVIEYRLTLLQFVKFHFCMFGAIYSVEKAGTNKYKIYDGFNGSHVYTVSKAKTLEPLTE